MGLGGGPNGAKATFKHKFASAFRDFGSLAAAREAVGVARSETLVVVDGNVLVMQTPASIDTFEAYVAVLANQLAGAIKAGAHVVVVFDEPAAMTRAKQEEQKARDARRTTQTPVCSDDLVACITDDNYGKAELEAEGLNVRLLINHRAARARFHDALCVATLEYLNTYLVGDPATTTWSVTFDGIDPRGADRPQGEPRVAGTLSSHPETWGPLLKRDQPIGEGDLKLTDVCQRVHRQRAANPDSPLAKVLLNMLWTIDTDSFLIELMQQARREARPSAEDRNELTLLCLREPSRKRKNEAPIPPHFLCVDMQCFFQEVMTYVYGTNVHLPDAARRKRHTAALFAASVALCGCDFVQITGMRCDLVLPSVRDVARNKPETLAAIEGAFTGRAEDARNAGKAIRAVVNNFLDSIAGNGGHLKRAHFKASAYNDLQILRACWITSYWLGHEFKNVHQWGFCHAALDTEGVEVLDGPPPPAQAEGRRKRRQMVVGAEEEDDDDDEARGAAAAAAEA